VFVPVQDDNPLRSISFQWVNLTLIAINCLAFVYIFAGGAQLANVLSLAVVPSELLDEGLWGRPSRAHKFDAMLEWDLATLITYQFLHGNIMHLVGNMLFLWVFGDNVEDAMGHLKYLLFYLLCGAFAALFHAWLAPTSDAPLIGASGAVAGVVAAYVILHPQVRVWVLMFRFIPLRVTALLALGAWILMQFVMPFLSDGAPIAWWAHIGGILAGAVLVLFMRRPGVPLFGSVPSG
jgi:membrane associated rhomboid family serine protease